MDWDESAIRGYETERFSFKKLFTFFGPGLLISVAYLDPGNIESDLQSGFLAKYKLIWVILCANVLALIVQRLALRIGNVTGLDLAEMCYNHYRTIPRLILWLMVEIAIIGADMQEVIGTAIAFQLLSATFSVSISLKIGIIVATLATFFCILLDQCGLRKLEYFLGLLVSIMAVTFGLQVYKIQPNLVDLSIGLIPSFSGWNAQIRAQAFGIIGAVIMPRNLFLHSALVQNRKVDRKDPPKIREANFYFFVEAAISLFVSFVINVLVVTIFAEGLYEKTNDEIMEQCKNTSLPFYDEAETAFTGDFNKANIKADVYNAGIFLGCNFGVSAIYIWGVGLLAAGLSSTMTGTLSGQFVLQGFLNLKCKGWQRVLVTRTITISLTLALAVYSENDLMPTINDWINAIMVLQLPFAIIPTIAFSSSKAIMGEFANGLTSRVLTLIISFVVILINMVFVGKIALETQFLGDKLWTIVACSGVYIAFNIYLIIHMCCAMGCQRLAKFCLVRHLVLVKGDNI